MKPNVAKPGALPSGGPVYLLGKMIGGMENPTSAKIWNSVGWSLGLQNKGAARCINQIVAARLDGVAMGSQRVRLTG